MTTENQDGPGKEKGISRYNLHLSNNEEIEKQTITYPSVPGPEVNQPASQTVGKPPQDSGT